MIARWTNMVVVAIIDIVINVRRLKSTVKLILHIVHKILLIIIIQKKRIRAVLLVWVVKTLIVQLVIIIYTIVVAIVNVRAN